jgi:hypothetical protein
VCTQKRRIKKSAQKKGLFRHLKMEIFEFFFFLDIVNTLSFKAITLVCQKTSFNVGNLPWNVRALYFSRDLYFPRPWYI